MTERTHVTEDFVAYVGPQELHRRVHGPDTRPWVPIDAWLAARESEPSSPFWRTVWTGDEWVAVRVHPFNEEYTNAATQTHHQDADDAA